ncbi:MAG: hypothetical protein U0575_09540 [Phycisphaerales bacterium]
MNVRFAKLDIFNMLVALLAIGAPAVACIPEDLDGSGSVDGADLGAVLSAWGPTNGFSPADLNGDGIVDGADLGLLLSAWGDVPASACPTITGAMPSSGGPGTVVILSGTFPDADPRNYALIAVTKAGVVVPFDVLSVADGSMTAVVGPVPAGADAGTLTLAMGAGTTVAVDDLPTGFNYGAAAWVWTASGAEVSSSVTFDFDVPGGPISGTSFASIVAGGFSLSVSGDCDTGTTLGIWLHARHVSSGPGDPFVAAALRVPSATLLNDLDPLPCASALGNLVDVVFNAQVPNPIYANTTTQKGPDGFILGIYPNNLTVTSGVFAVQSPP